MTLFPTNNNHTYIDPRISPHAAYRARRRRGRGRSGRGGGDADGGRGCWVLQLLAAGRGRSTGFLLRARNLLHEQSSLPASSMLCQLLAVSAVGATHISRAPAAPSALAPPPLASAEPAPPGRPPRCAARPHCSAPLCSCAVTLPSRSSISAALPARPLLTRPRLCARLHGSRRQPSGHLARRCGARDVCRR